MSAIVGYPRRHRVRASEFLQMGTAGVFAPEARLELLDGEIIEMAPIGKAHAALVDKLAQMLCGAVAGRLHVRVQGPLLLAEDSLPQPDVALFRAGKDEYFYSHPTPGDALLLIEVSDSTLRFDLEAKVPLYAHAGIPEVWVVDVERRRIHIFREPEGRGYGRSFVVTGGDSIQPLAVTGLSISPATIFPA